MCKVYCMRAEYTVMFRSFFAKTQNETNETCFFPLTTQISLTTQKIPAFFPALLALDRQRGAALQRLQRYSDDNVMR